MSAPARLAYPTMVGHRIGDRLNRVLVKQVKSGRLFVFFDANVFALHGSPLLKQIAVPKSRLEHFVLPSGEKSKSAAELARIHDLLLGRRIERDDFILAVGGGVTTDLVGYAAATVLRGVRWGAAPTTLLGMVDAAIGGKTGINHRLGKNLIGAFWQPKFVWAELSYLETLPDREFVAGLGEVLKYAGLAGGMILDQMEQGLSRGFSFSPAQLTSLVRQCASYKSDVVARDEREGGLRMILNFGHTFGHGLEKSLGYGRLLHGEAVIVGLCAALELGRRLGHDSRPLRRYRKLVESCVGFVPRRKVLTSSVLDAMTHDKKRAASGLRFVLIEKPGKPIIQSRIKNSDVERALSYALDIYKTSGGAGGQNTGR